MNAPTFKAHSHICPVCHRPHPVESTPLLQGLLICQHCRERLVITWSGHYVRDPFTLHQPASARVLRRESHPFFRILRDLRSPLTVCGVVLLGAVCFGLVSTLSDTLTLEPDRLPAPANPEALGDR